MTTFSNGRSFWSGAGAIAPQLARWLCLLALLPAAAHAQQGGDYAARLAELEGVMDFLKRFVYTIDERRPEKLLLTRR